MSDLSKIKLNGIEYNIKDTIARNAVAPPLATETTDGLLAASDKRLLNNLNPNIVTTLSEINISEFQIINAKEENMLSMTITAKPIIESQIRTSNLLNVDEYTPGFYIGSSGALANNANDRVGNFIPVSPGDDIYYTGTIGPTNSSSINRRLHVYTANQTWIKQLSFAGSLKIGDNWSTHGVVPANGAYVRVSWGVEDTNVMISVGQPNKYQPYYITPFDKITSTSFQIGDTDDSTEATTYTVNVPAAAGDQYGFTYNPIAGVLSSTTGHINSYNGETLPSYWWSDRDTYIEGTTPSIGAEVIYRLADEDIVEYSFTPMTIPLNYHINYFFINNGVLKEISYYAETLAMQHLTIYSGATFGETNILESDIIDWNHAANLIDIKANIDSPTFLGTPTAPTPGAVSNTTRLATTEFVQTKMNNIAPFEPTGKASRDYSIGEYVYVSGQLYKITTAIPKNSSITPGNNATATDVATELNLLFSLIQGGN